ncbi:PIR Superfamily Protein [Plasmodium ovale curtisi]|uniref:PIR Superfamily Protein n=1 Tax=Plasmodium ovale curtisi TaxID=864141 RepID=A0A1A8XBH7_PLAOA|nr:PIR Superfamily Protein [Plasmodium ovale curtisi]
MTRSICLNDLPSSQFHNELKHGIHYEGIVKNIERETFSLGDKFWKYTLNSYVNRCTRNSNDSSEYDDIENKKNIDDLCEDIAYINENISEIHSNDCKKIEGYIDQQITKLNSIYANSPSKYTHILEHYHFQSFDDFNSTITNLKSKCQEGAATASLVGHQAEMAQYSGKNASIIAVTSLSGILSFFILLYKTTTCGSILNTLIRKKIKFGNNLCDEAYYETLEDISESSHSGTYNILYNITGDS